MAHITGHYPATCSGRGRAQTIGSWHTEDAPQPPAISIPSLQPSHSTQFQFLCTLEHPCIIATISLAFREEPQSSEVPAHNI